MTWMDFGKWLLGLLRRVPWPVWVFLAAVAAFWLYGEHRHRQGKLEVRAEWRASIERGQQIVAQLKADQGKITVRTETVYVDRIRVIHEKGQTLIQRVPQLVPADACLLSAGFRLLHDEAAAAGQLPDPAGRPHATTGGPETIAWRPWNARPGAGGGHRRDRELHPGQSDPHRSD